MKEKKTKSKPMSLLNANENVLSNQQASEKHQELNSQPITGSHPIRHTQLQKSERMKMPIRAKKRKSSYKGKEKLVVHFPKRTMINEERKSNHKESNNNNPINSFNERKNKEQTK